MPTIEIVSDLVCPWCFIGLRRLAVAIEQVRRDVPDLECRKRWRPFFLNPQTPPEGEPYLPFLVDKFGSREAVEALFERVREAGRPYGIEYAFEKITLRANTLQAHRLIHWAQQQGDAEALVERLFVAQFQRGEYVGDVGLLAAIAGECGYSAADAAAYLASTQDTDSVRAMEADVRQAGIRQVPTFIVDRQQIVVGAEDPRVLAEAIRRALAAN
ncbi:DsbA family oxidoreductase [Dechloromonas agitata]|uniref:DsbA family oxidoreductase n=1 Tax=Dechloromonas agitata TaxID=73030 RepID=UPI00237E7ED6|nr:DsbA family oxidoreductase [Dechloromonas agitata]MDE1546756.1 DsbA family oxidoreductase [Dechloromonas agitata]